MSASHRQNSESPLVPAGQLRRLLRQVLRSDSQLEAFCIDYFPTVHQQFSGGMDQTQKLNLLLLGASPATLLERLRSYAPEVLEVKLSAPAASLPHDVLPRSWPGSHWGLGGLGLSCTLAAMVGGHWWLKYESAGTARTASTALVASTASPNSSLDPASATWLTSDPSAALVIEAATGRVLGQTPWTPDPIARSGLSPASRLRVCLRYPNFAPVLVTLEPGTEPIRPKHVQLQREPRGTQQREIAEEECNAPTPIIP